jgi:hypothetical protein
MSGGMGDDYRKVPRRARAYFSPNLRPQKKRRPPGRQNALYRTAKLRSNVLFVVFQDEGTEAEAKSDADDDAEQ